MADFGWAALGSTSNSYTATLNANIIASGLIFNSDIYTLAPSSTYSLTLGGSGITANVPATISAPLTLSASQTWTVANAGQTVTVSGAITNGGFLLTLSPAAATPRSPAV